MTQRVENSTTLRGELASVIAKWRERESRTSDTAQDAAMGAGQ